MSATEYRDQLVLKVSGRDQLGIVATIADVIRDQGGNIVSLDQYTEDADGGIFYQRTVIQLAEASARIGEIELALQTRLADPFDLRFRVIDRAARKRAVILASRADHCLLDLLWRHRRGELYLDIPLVIANHEDLREEVEQFGIPYAYVPSTDSDKSGAEAEILRLVQGQADFLILARYMQIISESFIDAVSVPIINIHHSFLPAFIGAGPYAKAKGRGVKLVGATAHYVTGDLDEGPIIEQDVVRVTHADDVASLQDRGADVERAVLTRAVRWHTDDRVFRQGNHTIIFD